MTRAVWSIVYYRRSSFRVKVCPIHQSPEIAYHNRNALFLCSSGPWRRFEGPNPVVGIQRSRKLLAELGFWATMKKTNSWLQL